MTRVLVAAGSAIVRSGLEAILSREPGIVIVARSGTIRTLADDAAEEDPDVIMVDLAPGEIDELLSLLSLLTIDADEGARVTPGVVILVDEGDLARFADAVHAGGRALLRRDAAPNEILAAVAAAAAGLLTVAPQWLDAITSPRSARARNAADGTPQAPLSGRELEVLGLIGEGLPNKQIAARLGISEHTVKFHVASIFAKLHATTRAEAVMNGARRGMIIL